MIMNISVAGKTIKIRKSGFICLLQKYIIYVYLSIMSNNFGFIDIILLAMIAGFIILRLRSILGRKTGYEEKSIQDLLIKNLRHLKKVLHLKTTLILLRKA